MSLARFAGYDWRERGLLLEAAAWLGFMRAAIRLTTFERVAGWLGLASGDGATPAALPDERAAQIGWAVVKASGATPWQSACLCQALAGAAMLSRRKISLILYLGVAPDERSPGKIAAHAWLQSGGKILTGEPGHERFTVVGRFERI